MATKIRVAVNTDEPCPVRVPFTFTFSDNGKILCVLPEHSAKSQCKVNITSAFSVGATIDIGYGATSTSAAITNNIIPTATVIPTATGTKTDEDIVAAVTEDKPIIVTIGGSPVVGTADGYLEWTQEYDAAT